MSVRVQRRDRIPVGAQLGKRQCTRVVGARIVAGIGHDGERPPGRERQLQAGVEHAEIGGTVIARALIVEPR